MELDKEQAKAISKMLDEGIEECIREKEELKAIREERELEEEMQGQRTRKEQVGDVILAYFKLVSIPTITLAYFAVARVLKGSGTFAVEDVIKTIAAIWITLVIISSFVTSRVRKLINFI